MMTRKHYKAIAEIVRQEREFARDIDGHCYNCQERLRHLMVELTDYLKQDNPRFSREKFLAACEL